MKLYETINAENWGKGILWRNGRGCILAHARLLGIRKDSQLRAAIKMLFPERALSVGGFNDHPDTTIQDVIRVCKVADV